MYNLRYHLASLVAVFLALALGLMLGSVVAERGYLDEQRAALVEGLQRDFDDLRATNDQLETEYERDHAFAVQIADAYSEGLLEGGSVLVISDAERSEAQSAVNAAVIGAGGRVVSIVFEEAGFGLDDPATRGAVMALDATPTPALGRDLGAEIAAGLAAELTTTAVVSDGYLDTLVERRVVSADGVDDVSVLSGVVIVASFDGLADPFITQLGVRLSEAGLRVLGAEVSWRDDGVVSASLEAGLSAIDHADLPQGALSTVMILAGEAEGHYGTRNGSSGINPPLLR